MDAYTAVESFSIGTDDGQGIPCRIYGNGNRAVILSNMDTNQPEGWDGLIPALVKHKYSVLTYTYCRTGTDCLHDLYQVLCYFKARWKKKYILIGGSRGGVISLCAVIDSFLRDDIDAVIALSAPQVYEGVTFYTDDELAGITVPVFLVNSEHDEGIGDTHRMYDLLRCRKDLLICSGGNHGTDIFLDNKDLLVSRICDFLTKTVGQP